MIQNVLEHLPRRVQVAIIAMEEKCDGQMFPIYCTFTADSEEIWSYLEIVLHHITV